jgi:hypothetical protein
MADFSLFPGRHRARWETPGEFGAAARRPTPLVRLQRASADVAHHGADGAHHGADGAHHGLRACTRTM